MYLAHPIPEWVVCPCRAYGTHSPVSNTRVYCQLGLFCIRSDQIPDPCGICAIPCASPMVILDRKPYQLFSGRDFERPLNGKVSIFQFYVAINCSFTRESALPKCVYVARHAIPRCSPPTHTTRKSMLSTRNHCPLTHQPTIDLS